MFSGSRSLAVVASLTSAMVISGFAATPANAADALGPCPVTISGSTYTLTADCQVTTAIDVPDGATLDGDGHTITAVEGPTESYAGGSVIRSAVGDDTTPATLNVRNLTITTNFTSNGGSKNSGGTLNGIYLLRAGGTIENVTVDGISHGNGVQEGIGIRVRNRDLSAAAPADIAVPEATVTITDTTVTRFQKGGIVLDGNVDVAVNDVTIGRGLGPNGEINSDIAANGLQLSRGAHGTVTNTRVAPNYYKNPSDAAATGILIWNSGAVTVSRSVVSGVTGNEGIDVSSDGSYPDVTTAATISCTLVQLTGATPEYSLGISNTAPASLDLRDSTVTGFETPISGVSPSTGGGDCLAPAPVVTAVAGDRSVHVEWVRDVAPEYAPVTGQEVVLTATGEAPIARSVAGGADTAFFTGLKEGVTYTATVSVANVSGTAGASASATVPAGPVVTQTLTLSRNHKVVVKGHKVVFKGKLGPARKGVAVYLLARTTGVYNVVKSAVVRSRGSYRFVWMASGRIGAHTFTVHTLASTGYAEAYSTTRVVKVKKV